MKRNKEVLITVISTLIEGQKHYVGTIFRRNWDNRFLISQHTTDPNEAREFRDADHALDTIRQLVNHYGRTYTVENVMVKVSRIHPVYDEDEMT